MSNRGASDAIAPVDLGMFAELRARLPATVDLTELGIAAISVLAAILVGYLVARLVSKRLARFADGASDDDVPLKYQPLLKSAATILRFAITALLILLARSVWHWEFFGEVLIGFSLALIVGLLVYTLLRALSIGYWTAMAASTALFALVFSETIGGLTSMSSLLDQASFVVGDKRFSLLTLVTLALVAIFLVAAVRLASSAVKLVLRRHDALDDGQRLLGEKLAMVALVIAAFFIGIDLLGIDLTAFAVFSGAFGLAIGFGLQKTFGNLIAGIILLMDRSIKPGDVIALGDTYGWVNKIGTRAVSIITRDGKEHLIPNEILMTEAVENWSYSSTNLRVRIPVGVSYSSDMQLVQDLLRLSLEGHKRILKRPEPRILMTGFGDSSVNFEIRAWIRDPQEGIMNFRSDIYKNIWKLFKQHNIEIPFPQRDLNIRNVEPGTAAALAQTQAKPKAKAAVKKPSTKT